MCTISWLSKKSSYHLFFNRDETLSREEAIAPQVKGVDGFKWIFPIDPVGGGTWIAVSEHKIILALLNHYSSHLLKKNSYLSRGTIIPQFFSMKTTKDCLAYLNRIQWDCFAPCYFLCLSPRKKNIVAKWDGIDLTMMSPDHGLTTSSYQPKSVVKRREETFKKTFRRSEDFVVKSFLQYHSSHLPDKGSHSVCMHRSNRKTVSFSHISIEKDKTLFRYQSDSPCQNQPITTSSFE